MTPRIRTHLMFEGAAEQAMALYVGLFEDAAVLDIDRYGPEGPGRAGSVRRATFRLGRYEVVCIDSPVAHAFSFTPAMSIFVDCADAEEQSRLYAALVEGGEALMPLDDYGFSRRFGWIKDRFGVSWQLDLQ